MFHPKYATSLVTSTVGIDIQIILWEMIAKWENEDSKVSDFQIYELSVEYAGGEIFQKIVHKQEVPSRVE
jgi:plastocyanin domain-containing protein